MPYYNSSISEKYPDLINYFKTGICDENKNISHCLLFWGPDTQSQYELALEIARLLNCTQDKNNNCECINCKWIREEKHPAVKTYTRLDFKEGAQTSSDEEDSVSGTKNITVAQAHSIINELSLTSDYHRVYIFCDRDEDGNLLPLNQINFPEKTSNSLLKTFEEPPQNTTFIFLTKSRDDIISTVVSRAQSFFVPFILQDNQGYELVQDVITNYWETERNDVLDFEEKILNLISDNDAKIVLKQIQNYMVEIMKSNFDNKEFLYMINDHIKYVEDALRQLSLTPAMNIQTVIENLCFKIIL